MSTGSIGLDYLVEDIKHYVPADVLEAAAKGGAIQMKETLLDDYFKSKGQGTKFGWDNMSDKKRDWLKALAEVGTDWSLSDHLTDEFAVGGEDEELAKARIAFMDSVIDSYAKGEASDRQARVAFKELGGDDQGFEQMYMSYYQKKVVEEELGTAAQAYRSAKRLNALEVLPEETKVRASSYFRMRGKAGAIRQKEIKRYSTFDAKLYKYM